MKIKMEPNTLLHEIQKLLKQDPAKMFSREEILNILAPRGKDKEVERLLAELEVGSSVKDEGQSSVYATCRGGTVYYRWNKRD